MPGQLTMDGSGVASKLVSPNYIIQLKREHF